MNILKKLFRKLLDLCVNCGCPNIYYSSKSKKPFCFCGCDMKPVTREAEKEKDENK